MIQQSWEAITLELGLPGHLTDWDHKKWGPTTTDCGVKTVWKYCQEQQLEVDDNFATLTLHREHDQFLMEAFGNIHQDPKTLNMLNQCRCFLQVVTLSGISTADGRQLLPGIGKGKHCRLGQSQHKWPRQPPRLSRAHWELWEKTLKQCFVQDYTRFRLLKKPLGAWLTPP